MNFYSPTAIATLITIVLVATLPLAFYDPWFTLPFNVAGVIAVTWITRDARIQGRRAFTTV